MEFWKPDNVKTQQSTTVRNFICKVQNLVKFVEVTTALILIFWSTTRLPSAVELLIVFTKQLSAPLLSTPSVFLIGNAIIVALVGNFQSSLDSKSDLYEEFVSESRGRVLIESSEVEEDLGNPIVICSEPPTTEKMIPLLDSTASLDSSASSECVDVDDGAVLGVKCYRRTQSETIVESGVRKELRRSMTENYRMSEVVDDLSNDEFRQTVEAFIAKQQRFLMDENMALVLST